MQWTTFHVDEGSSVEPRKVRLESESSIKKRASSRIKYRHKSQADTDKESHRKTMLCLSNVRNDPALRESLWLLETPNIVYSSHVWQRALTWGTPWPMSWLEQEIHREVRIGLGLGGRRAQKPLRQFLSLGTRVLPGGISVTVVITEPALSTSTVSVSRSSLDRVGEEASKVSIVSASSTGNDRCTPVALYGPSVSGRLAASVAEAVEGRAMSLKDTVYVNLASSVTYVLVSKPLGYDSILVPSPDTMSVLSVACPPGVCMSRSLEVCRIYLPSSQSSRMSNLKISGNGTLKMCGSPRDVRPLFSSLADLVAAVLLDDRSTIDLVLSCSCLEHFSHAR